MCFCGNTQTFEQCCKPFISGQSTPINSEQLMRSRFSAYCTQEGQYILDTYASQTRSEHTVKDILAFAKQVSFVKLDVITTDEDAQYQYVEFKAYYIEGTQLSTLHERSRFIKEGNQWLYLDGELFPTECKKVSRNDPCPCLSGKKFKKCHG
ncbi:preprotein translocase subunit SecA [Pseudoalteromonas luteoviolacea]|uniref:Preprotein translocase subunit SecA n=1 Tax=Pseudoalteromonas luteoviolacea TaxID=43657 RepID=A0A0C1QGX9_9GAMM|nr:YchJ family metal-binding protein [Pseudoalteromonas luteoviolacea]KID58575.1 preprotein translocase subunit SecA [Pseudoalteromonas luteoviolacea]